VGERKKEGTRDALKGHVTRRGKRRLIASYLETGAGRENRRLILFKQKKGKKMKDSGKRVSESWLGPLSGQGRKKRGGD